MYSASSSGVQVHLYAGSEATVSLRGQDVLLRQETDYPCAGDVRISVRIQKPMDFSLECRIPGWCAHYSVEVNGKRVQAQLVRGYARLRREWKDGDEVVLSFAMPIERIQADPRVVEDTGKAALQRGPLIYCLEGCDNPADPRGLVVPLDAVLKSRWQGDLLGGVVRIAGACRFSPTEAWKGTLYRRSSAVASKAAQFRAVPYFAWDNRKVGPMAVWLAQK